MRRAGVIGLLFLAAVARAEPYAVGGTLRPFALPDQHGERAEVGEATRIVLVSRDMKAGDIVKGAFAGADQKLLDERKAAYVADISRMPAVISRLFALPRMRERPYRVLIDRDGKVAADFPYTESRPTLVFVEQLGITRIEHPASAEELKKAIGGGS